MTLFAKCHAIALMGIALFTSACHQAPTQALAEDYLTIGVSAGIHEDVLNVVKKLAEKEGLTITIKSFSEGNPINAALADGSLDVNIYQTLPYLQEQMSNHGHYDFVPVFGTLASPLAIYATQYRQLSDIKLGDQVAVPNDTANELRALRLFEAAGLIKLNPNIGENGTIRDIIDNPLKLKFVALAGAQLPLQLPDLAAAAINGNFAQQHGLTIPKNGLFQEEDALLYPNYAVVRRANKHDAVIKRLRALYQSPSVAAYIQERYQGSIVPTFVAPPNTAS